MSKIFISHSSKDKERYVNIVVNNLIKNVSEDNLIYDSLTFESGARTLDEIKKNLYITDLFVIMISDYALNSEWVMEELKIAESLYNEKKIEMIFPILIDANISHEDKRLPKLLTNNYNLKFIPKPSKAANLIFQKMVELSYTIHPNLKERSNIFVGRNDYIKKFEERIDDFSKPAPTCLICSGIKSIGRSSLIKQCITKSNIKKDVYQPLEIFLNSNESIEDLIFKIYDLGYSPNISLDKYDFLKMELSAKIDLLTNIFTDIKNENEIIFIKDVGCLISSDGKISNWLLEVLSSKKLSNKVLVCIISKYRLHLPQLYKYEYLYNIELSELEKLERNGLLKRYLEFKEMNLEKEDFKFIADLLKGYPEQIFFAVELLDYNGIKYLKDNSFMIVEFNSRQASMLIDKYDTDEKALNFLRLLSEFDYVSIEFILDIVDKDKTYSEYLEVFFNQSICEYAGINKEYVRLNDVIRDYIQRSNLGSISCFKQNLDDRLKKFLNDYKIDDYNLPEYLYAIKNAIQSGQTVNERHIIPSIYLKSMIELYRKSRYNEVIKFADKALENEQYMDERIVFDIRFFLCSSLAKLGNERILKEVQYFHDADKDFLLAFYYRNINNNKKALTYLTSCLNINNNYSQAKRELVQIYMNLQEFNTASTLAKENYLKESDNPYHIQAYFSSLIKGEKNSENECILKELLKNLSLNKSEKAKEMLLRCNAQFEAFYNNNEDEALAYINSAINDYPQMKYAILVKFDICSYFKRISDMEEIIDYLKKNENIKKYHNNIILFESILYAHNGNIDKALSHLTKIRYYTDEAIERVKQKLIKISSSSFPRQHQQIS